MKNILKTNALKGVLLVGMLFASAAFCEVSYGSLTDTRDGKSYKTVRIGTQTWMAENLNYKTDESYCYEDNPGSCRKYGRLYTWATARNACPVGWHLPSRAEWMTLEEFVANSLFGGKMDSVGYALKSTSGWEYFGGKLSNGSDAFGFGALPAAYRFGERRFVLGAAYFWSTSKYVAYFRYLYYDDTFLGTSDDIEDRAMSVRCVKDS